VESRASIPPTYPPSPSSSLPLVLGGGEAKGRPPPAMAAGRAPRLDRSPSLGCPPKDMLKLDHFSISFGDFSFFLYIKLKWSSLGSPLGFSFCENFRMLKKKQEWQWQCQCFVPPPLQKMFSLCYVGPLFLRFFPQVLYMPHIMNLKKLRFVHFNKVTQTGVKGC
jgi:hypothetical protein